MQKIYITGPESTGKTSLCKSLSAHFGCPWVPEYARQYLFERGGIYTAEDLVEISKGQLDWNASFEMAMLPLLIFDTGQAVLHVWAHHKYGEVDKQIEEGLQAQKGALHILCNPDLIWEADPQREHPNDRAFLFQKYESLLQNYQLDYEILKGRGNTRIDNAVQLVEKFMRRISLK